VLSSEGPKVRALTLILIVALIGAGFYLLTPAGRQLLDRARITMTRWDNQSRYRSGQPLPGTPDLARLDERLAAHGVKLGVPVVVRIFKLESELELWVEKDGRFVRFATYPVCLWSGRLGPKLREGDRQAPEGFYTVAAEQLNPNSRWHRLQSRLPQRLRPGSRAGRLLHHGARGLLLDRLLRHDRPCGR
jgi:hypothetical protein